MIIPNTNYLIVLRRYNNTLIINNFTNDVINIANFDSILDMLRM